MKQDLQYFYNRLVANGIPFVCDINGVIRDIWTTNCKIDIFPGSFNPLHEAHKSIFDAIPYHHLSIKKCFEISIQRVGKESIPCFTDHDPDNLLNSLYLRLEQFQGYAPVIITNAARFIEKVGVLRNYKPRFHIGADTLSRMIDDYTLRGIYGIASEFVVYDRIVDGNIIGLKSLCGSSIPENCKLGTTPNRNLLGISSTEIRNKQSKENTNGSF